MSELEILGNYLRITLMLFFITFFMGIFIQYFKTKTITPRKMLTYKPGGLFEHYKIVAVILFTLFVLHGLFDQNPFEPGIVGFILDLVLTYIPFTIFFIFFFVFLFFFLFYLYAKITRQENPGLYLNKKSHLIIHLSFILAIIMASIAIAFVLLNA